MRGAGHRAAAAALLIAGSALGAACDLRVGDGGLEVGVISGKAQDEWARTYDLAAGGRFEVVNVNGQVRIEAGPEGKVEVRAERIAKASSDDAARDLLKELQIVEEVSSDAVRLESRHPSGFGRRGFEVRYFVTVPPSAVVKARTQNGGIHLAGLANTVEARTVNGGVKAVDLSGAADVSTTNGGLDVSLERVADGGVTLGAVNGGIVLQLPRDARADLSARVTNGGVSVGDLPVSVSDQNRRRLEGRMNGGGPKIEISTTNGGIRVSGR